MNAFRFTFAAACAAMATAASADAQEAADAQPRIVALTENDQRHYAAAFSAIEDHNWDRAREELAAVDDDSLVGVARGRMLANRSYRASYSELTNWLRRYGDLGVAPVVYDRAQDARPHRGRGRRRRAVGPAPPQPEAAGVRIPYGASRTPPGDTTSARSQINSIIERVAANDLTGARSVGDSALFGPRAGEANWWMGLVAYRERDYARATQHFDAAANWPYFSTWTSSASHYWAARSRIASGAREGVSLHLEAAAQNPYTFYGQLAEEQLGRESGLTFERPPLNAETLTQFFERRPGARRAAALAQLGRLSDVEAELRRLHSNLSPSEDPIFLALAGALQAPSAQLRAAEYGPLELSAGFCPDTSFQPANGFNLDRALVYAIVRQESHFNPVAISSSNARGLMQLLPSTASDMDRSTNYRRQPALLHEPGLNMQLGQQYVRWLMDMFHQDQDLGRVFAAYNGGPGWLQRWMATQPNNDDPLMLLETMPRQESRDYAERVLAHMGVCRARYGQDRVELERMAQGQAARYEPQDNRSNTARVASR